MEDAEHAHLGRSGVLQAVRQSGRQVQAGARAKGMLGAADVRCAVTMEYQHDLVVRMAVFMRAPLRDLAYEWGGSGAPAFWAEQGADPPVPGCLDLAVGEVPAPQRAGVGIWPCRTGLAGGRQRNEVQPQFSVLAGQDPEV